LIGPLRVSDWNWPDASGYGFAGGVTDFMAEKPQNRLAGKRVTVTGGAGFLGSHVVEELRRAGCAEVFAPRSREFGFRAHTEFEAGLSRTIEWYRGQAGTIAAR
jgi:hypothetical protein